MSSCTSSQTWCYATVCRLALPHIHDATLLYVVLHSSHIWCYATVCRLAFRDIHDATLLYVVLHFQTYMMLRYCMSSCTPSHTWCYATVCRLALPHIYDATLLYVVLHFLTYMMLRYCMSSCTFSQIWCYVIVCRLALPHIYDATLLYVVLHFLTYMMLRYLCGVGWGGVITFICTSSHTLMSEDVKAMVNQWVFRQSLGPITPIAFLEELKRLLKQWGKKAMKCCFAVVWNKAKMRNVKKHWVFFWKSHFVPRPSIKRGPSVVRHRQQLPKPFRVADGFPKQGWDWDFTCQEIVHAKLLWNWVNPPWYFP